MANYRINVGNVYERIVRNGNLVNKSKLTVHSVDLDNEKVVCKTAGGKEVVATPFAVKQWKLLKYIPIVKEKKHRLNKRYCVDVAIDTILSHNCGMSAKEIVECMKNEGTYIFAETAKTPINSVSSRLNSYITEFGKNSKIKHIKGKKGIFYPIDYELPTETAE